MKWNNLVFSSVLSSLWCEWYFDNFNLVSPTGPCSPMKETAMMSAWQTKEVNEWISFIFWSGMGSHSSGISGQKARLPRCLLLPLPIVVIGKKCPRLHNQPQWLFDCSTLFLYQMGDWKSWSRNLIVEKSCTPSVESRIQILVSPNMSSSIGLVLNWALVRLFGHFWSPSLNNSLGFRLEKAWTMPGKAYVQITSAPWPIFLRWVCRGGRVGVPL